MGVLRQRFQKNARLLIAGLACALLLTLSLTTVGQPAMADTQPPAAGTPATASTSSLPTAQMNGVAWDQVIVGNTVYVGGDFSKARPAGSALGTNEVARTFLLSYNLATGILTPWAPVLNGQVRSMVASPDGTRLYVVGAFTSVNGVAKNRIVAFSTATGAIDPTFTASANGQVFAVTASASAVYFGGQFTASNSVQRPGGAAAVNAATSAVLPWAPILGSGRAFAMQVSPDNSEVVIGGNFTTLNGNSNPGYGMGSTDTNTGASLPWAVGTVVLDAGPNAATYNLTSDGENVYGAVYTFGSGGNLEGGWSARWNGGAVNWIQTCSGDTYSVAVSADTVYYAGHSHDCGTNGGFPQTQPWTWYRGVAFSKNASTVAMSTMKGQPQPTMLQFYPTLNIGTFTGQNQGPWSVAANSQYVTYAGEFTTVNGVAQQGLSRFATAAVSPGADGPRLSGTNFPLTLASYASGTMKVSWPSNNDRDNQKLSYSVSRNGVAIYTTTNFSSFWDQPNNSFIDTGLTPGMSYTYRVTATDPFGNAASSAPVAGTVSSSETLSPYLRAVVNDSPSWLYQLSEATGSAQNSAGLVANTTASGAVTQATPAVVGPAATRGVPGPPIGQGSITMQSSAMQFNGTADSRVYSPFSTWADSSISVEAWFKTTAASGKIAGFGTSASSINSSTQDRSLYMNGGRLLWSVNDGSAQNIQSTALLNDGVWHYAVGSISPGGMTLYVDGLPVASKSTTTEAKAYWGYWHIGGDTTPAGSQNFTGTLANVAVYKNPLTDGQVAAHYAAATNQTIQPILPPANPPPVVNPAPVVPAAGILAADKFGRTLASGWGTAETGGVWSTTANPNYFVSNGSASFVSAVATTRRAVLPAVSSLNTDAQVTLSVDKAALGGPYYAGIVGRQIGSDYYQARVRYVAGGGLELMVMHGGSTVLQSVATGFTVVAGQKVQLRVQTSGSGTTMIRAKAWITGSPEPSAWTASATDTTPALQGSGYVGMESYLSASSTVAPVTVSFSNFTASAF